jgi:hypothetical protein
MVVQKVDHIVVVDRAAHIVAHIVVDRAIHMVVVQAEHMVVVQAEHTAVDRPAHIEADKAVQQAVQAERTVVNKVAWQAVAA